MGFYVAFAYDHSESHAFGFCREQRREQFFDGFFSHSAAVVFEFECNFVSFGFA